MLFAVENLLHFFILGPTIVSILIAVSERGWTVDAALDMVFPKAQKPGLSEEVSSIFSCSWSCRLGLLCKFAVNYFIVS